MCVLLSIPSRCGRTQHPKTKTQAAKLGWIEGLPPTPSSPILIIQRLTPIPFSTVSFLRLKSCRHFTSSLKHPSSSPQTRLTPSNQHICPCCILSHALLSFGPTATKKVMICCSGPQTNFSKNEQTSSQGPPNLSTMTPGVFAGAAAGLLPPWCHPAFCFCCTLRHPPLSDRHCFAATATALPTQQDRAAAATSSTGERCGCCFGQVCVCCFVLRSCCSHDTTTFDPFRGRSPPIRSCMRKHGPRHVACCCWTPSWQRTISRWTRCGKDPTA